jgi:hypothetical protein
MMDEKRLTRSYPIVEHQPSDDAVSILPTGVRDLLVKYKSQYREEDVRVVLKDLTHE